MPYIHRYSCAFNELCSKKDSDRISKNKIVCFGQKNTLLENSLSM